MIRTFRAEMVKLRRPRVVLITTVLTVLFAVVSALVVLSSAEPAAQRPERGPGTSLEALSGAGGGTEVFTTATAFAGTFIFVLFVGAIAVEFGRGTIRTMLLRQPRRAALLVGKVGSLLAFAAMVLGAALVFTWIAARVFAPSQDVPTDGWLSAKSIGEALGDYVMVLFWVTGYAVLATALAVVVRSVPIALAIGIAWAGPFEHILQDGVTTVSKFFPGLLLEAFVAGGTTDVSALRAFATLAVYVLIGGAVAIVNFTRRDVTV